MAKRPAIPVFLLACLLTWAGWGSLNALLSMGSPPAPDIRQGAKTVVKKIVKPDKEWKDLLTPERYRIMIGRGTEPAFSGTYNDFYEKGTYVCAACGNAVFRSEAKYDHGTGWPSFTEPFEPDRVEYRDDHSMMMRRVEVRCAACGAHLGHVFDDGPSPSRRHYCINSVAMDFLPAGTGAAAGPASPGLSRDESPKKASPAAKATFSAGCFWGVEHEFRRLAGVIETIVGYTGGHTENPSYREVCTDKTGHAEAVQITFDPDAVGYDRLLDFFFNLHDPTQVNRQGPDAGTQYRSAVFYHDESQKIAALKKIRELEKSGRYGKRIATQVVPASVFFKAEEDHQRYYEKNKIKGCGF